MYNSDPMILFLVTFPQKAKVEHAVSADYFT